MSLRSVWQLTHTCGAPGRQKDSGPAARHPAAPAHATTQVGPGTDPKAGVPIGIDDGLVVAEVVHGGT